MIMKFEDRLKQYRENKGWTQAELGEKSGVEFAVILYREITQQGVGSATYDAVGIYRCSCEIDKCRIYRYFNLCVVQR